MPDPSSLEQVKELIRQLTSEERRLVLTFIASLEESNIIVQEVLSFPLSPEDQKKRAEAIAAETYYTAFTPYGA
jgi:hypothetical protein